MLLILKLDKSKDVKEVHSENIPPISVTSDISKLDKFKDFKEDIFRKILPTFFNFTLPKSFIFKDVIDEHPQNILFPRILCEKSNCEKSISIILLQSLNRHPQFSPGSCHIN